MTKCLAGTAVRKITPPEGSALGGYPHKRVAGEVKSELYTRALVIEAGGTRIAISANDLCSVQDYITLPAKEIIFSKCGIPPEAVMITATHTHTGPAVAGLGAPGNANEPDPSYIRGLADNIAKGVCAASESMFQAEIFFGKTAAEGYSSNKLCRLKNGGDVYNMRPMDGGKDGRIGFSGPLDDSLQVLCVKDRGGKARAFAVNFAAHPNSGPDIIWAEWPGELSDTVSRVYGEDVPCLFLQGTAGDVDCTPNMARERTGRGIAGAAIMAAERVMEPAGVTPVDYRLRNIKLPRLVKTHESDRIIEEIKKKPVKNNLEEAWIKKYENWSPHPEEARVPVQCVRIGDMAITGLPGEIFTSVGLEIKRYSPSDATMVVELANDAAGYFPPVEQACRGGYGEWPFGSRRFCPEAATIMANAAIEMLHDMWDAGK